MSHAKRSTISLTLAAVLLAGCATMDVGHPGADGRLKPCPSSPNCVCSDDTDTGHKIEALAARADPSATWQKLIQLLEADRSMTIVERGAAYLHVEARSRIFRFVDDVEFQLRAEEGIIAMRSASRVGYSDLGANRKRLEKLRQSLMKD